MYRYKIVHQLSLALIFVGCCLFASSQAKAQGKQAILILLPTNADAGNAGCEGAADVNYQILYDVKLNAKDEIRLMNAAGGGAQSTVTREAYEHTSKSKMRDFYSLKWGRDGALYAVSVAGQAPIITLPDNMKPKKEAGSQPVSSFYDVMLTGEARENKQKRKVNLALRTIWKIYFIAEGGSVNDTLYNHAADEASVALWEAYLQKTGNYRSSEANAKMRDALVTCARVDLDRFTQGDYNSLDKATQKATRAQSVKDDELTRRLVADIRSALQQVEDARNKAEVLIKAEKWDEAIDAAEPIRKYLDTWPDLNQMYKHALGQSHEIHLNAGDKAFLVNQLETSLNDCTIARNRLPNSDRALFCVCRARNEIALRDSKKNRQIKKPKDAKELLEHQLADSDCKQDPRVTVELKVAKCEYAQQLYAEGRQLLGVGGTTPRPTRSRRRGATSTLPQQANSNVNVKLITMQSKKDFRNAREKLVLAAEMCDDNDIQSLLATTNRHLSEFCVSEARNAMKRNDNGTAYVYLQKAQGYTPDNSTVSEMLVQAKEKFQEQTRVNVGVVFANRSGNGYAEGLLNEVAASVESASMEAGLSQPSVLARDDAGASLRAIQSGRPLGSPTVVFFGDLLTAGVKVDRNSFSVSSTFSYPNPERERWDRSIDVKNNQLDNCKKQYGDAACAGVREERDQMRATRDSLPRRLEQAYSYSQTDFRLQGAARMSFRSTDSISSSTSAADTLSDEVGGQCQQREGVNGSDTRGASNSICRIDDEGTYLRQMFNKISTEAHSRAVESLRVLPSSYYRRAQSSANKQQAIESYLRFLFLTSNKSGSEAEQAKSFLVAYDPELNTDGVLR